MVMTNKMLSVVAVAVTFSSAATDFNLRGFGAKPDGSKCTKAFAAAFAAAEKTGGGRVVVPCGKWFTGAIRLRSNCELHLEDGAEVVFSQDSEDYLPAVFTSWEGMECWNYCPLVYAYGCTNVAITGNGTLCAYEGRWEDTKWYPWVPQENGIKAARLQLYTWGATDYPVEKREIWKMPNAHTRPHFIQFNRCRNVRLEDFKVRNSPFWTIHIYLCEDATARGLDVYAHGDNNDGIDIEMSKNVLVEKCVFDQGDDGIVIKSGRNRDAWRIGKPTENVLVRDCEIRNAHTVLGVGSEISGGVRNVRMKDCTAGEVYRIFYVKTNERRGGFVEDVRMENVTAKKARWFVMAVETDVLYEWAEFPTYEVRITPIKNLSMRNVSVGSAERMVSIIGDARLPVDGVTLENVRVGKVRARDRIENAVNVLISPQGPAPSQDMEFVRETVFEANGEIGHDTEGFEIGDAKPNVDDRVAAKAMKTEATTVPEGRIVSRKMWFPHKIDGKGAYFRVSFDAKCDIAADAPRGYQGVFFYGRNGKELTDCYDTLYPGDGGRGTGSGWRHYERVFYAWDEVSSVEVFFQRPADSSPESFAVANVKVETATWEDAARYCDSVLATVNANAPFMFAPKGDWTVGIPRTMEALKSGKEWHVVMLGDSIMNDTFHSQFHSLVKRAYPKSDVEWRPSIRSATGCWHYILADNFYEYIASKKPDLLVIGGISNYRTRQDAMRDNNDIGPTGADAMVRVAKTARDRLGCEVLLVNMPLNRDFRPHADGDRLSPIPEMPFSARWLDSLTGGRLEYDMLRGLCERERMQWWDATTPCYTWLFGSGLPLEWFSRDAVHSGECGKQIIGRVMLGYLTSCR